MSLLACLRGHGSYPRQYRGAIDGGRIFWVAPSYPQIQASHIWEDLKLATEKAWIRKSEVDREIILPGGGSIAVKSSDNPDSLRGPGLDGVVMDEAAFQSPEVWRSIIRPALADKQGWAILPTTPNGKNWIHKLSLAVQRGELADWGYWNSPSSENPLVTAEELESIKAEIGPRAYSQEFDAKYTESEGAVFPGSYFEDHIWVDTQSFPNAFEVSGLYADPSLGKESKSGDYQAVAFAGLAGGLWWVKLWMVKLPPLEFVRKMIQIHRIARPTFTGIEANGFQSILSPLFDLVCEQDRIPPLPLIPVNNSISKGLRIQSLDPLLASRKIRFMRCEGSELCIEQAQMFPDKAYHDDGPDALHGVIDLVSRQIGAAVEESHEGEVEQVAT